MAGSSNNQTNCSSQPSVTRQSLSTKATRSVSRSSIAWLRAAAGPPLSGRRINRGPVPCADLGHRLRVVGGVVDHHDRDPGTERAQTAVERRRPVMDWHHHGHAPARPRPADPEPRLGRWPGWAMPASTSRPAQPPGCLGRRLTSEQAVEGVHALRAQGEQTAGISPGQGGPVPEGAH